MNEKEKTLSREIYKYMYQTPDNFSNIIMNSDGEYLTGYGGGIKNKIELLKIEGNDMSKYFIPKGM